MMSNNDISVAIYDLSMGVAATLSAQVLGPSHSISIVPHTSILAYGYEFFFSSEGIQEATPQAFRTQSGLRPIQILPLGPSNKSHADFSSWCYTGNDQFYEGSYDLFHRNCNNFSDAAAKFLCNGKGIPQYILDIPKKVSSSPLGQMFYQSAFGGGIGLQPPGVSPVSSSQIDLNQLSSATQPEYNPWADLKPVKKTGLTPILSAHNKYLLSTSTAPISICIQKLRPHFQDRRDEILGRLEEELLDQNPKLCTVRETIGFILENDNDSAMIYALMLLRLVVLYSPKDSAEKSTVEDSAIVGCVQKLTEKMLKNTLKAHRLRSTGWCVLSNAFLHKSYLTFLTASPELIVDCALKDFYTSSPDLRQSALSFLHNFVQFSTQADVQGWAVNILLGMMEGLEDEEDDIVTFRRCLVVGKLIKFDAIKDLANDLGFGQSLLAVKGEKSQDIAKEINGLMLA